MTLYTLDILELRSVACRYVVEAESLDEAVSKALNGYTLAEIDDRTVDIYDRQLVTQADEHLHGEQPA